MKFLVHSLFILFVSTSFFAQVDRSIMPKPGKASIININESQVFTLANGLTVIVSENHKIPKEKIENHEKHEIPHKRIKKIFKIQK